MRWACTPDLLLISFRRPMGIVGGTTITLIADGSDEKEAVEALAELINGNFGE